jgi:hypothetical protein
LPFAEKNISLDHIVTVWELLGNVLECKVRQEFDDSESDHKLLEWFSLGLGLRKLKGVTRRRD